MAGEGKPDMSQVLLQEVLKQLSEVGGRLGVLQGQASEIIREQQRAADGRKEIYAKVNRIPAIEAELGRLSPLVDRHERKQNEAAGAMWLGKVMLPMGSGVFGAGLTLAIKWLSEGRAPHP